MIDRQSDEYQRVITTLKNLRANNERLEKTCSKLREELNQTSAQKKNLQKKLTEMKKATTTDKTMENENAELLIKIKDLNEQHEDYISQILDIKSECQKVVTVLTDEKKKCKKISSKKKKAINKIRQLTEIAKQITPDPETLRKSEELSHKFLNRKEKWEQEKKELTDLITKLKAERDEIFEKAEIVQGDIDQRVGIAGDLDNEINTRDQKISDYQIQIKEANEEYKKLLDELDETKSVVNSLTTEGNELQKKINESNNLKQKLDIEYEDIKAKITNQKEKIPEFKKKLEDSIREMYEEADDETSQQIEEMQQIVSQKDEEIQKLKEELAKAEATYTDLNSKILIMNENHDMERKQLNDAKEQLETKFMAMQKMIEVITQSIGNQNQSF